MLLRILLLLVLLIPALQPPPVRAHGSVTADDDLCILQIGYYRAHFKIFQPGISGREDFCEDIPNAGETIFVMEYQHQSLGDARIDFRIIRDITGLGRFAEVSDLYDLRAQAIEEATVYYRPPATEPGVYTINHEFAEAGTYIGIVNVENPETGATYSALFPFRVGFTGFGILPLFVGLGVLVQLLYWYFSGGYRRWRDKQGGGETVTQQAMTMPNRKPAMVILLVPLLALVMGAAAPQTWESDRGLFRISYTSEVMPVPMNRIHQWTFHVETADGEPVADADIEVGGGMPAHDHGLPTAPQVTGYLGNGDYRVGGMRFHMMGDWEITLTISHDGITDRVTIPLTL